MSDGVYVHITGRDIYETLLLPEAPHKGDVLWLSSLTRGACKVTEALVSEVAWAMDQTSGTVTVWVKVRRRAPVRGGLLARAAEAAEEAIGS